MKRQQAACTVERSIRRGLDEALMQTDAAKMHGDDFFRRAQHVGGRIDAVEGPAGLRIGERFQFEPAAGAVHQHAAVARHTLRQQHDCHPMQALETRHLPWRAFGIDARMTAAERGCGGGGHGRVVIVIIHAVW